MGNSSGHDIKHGFNWNADKTVGSERLIKDVLANCVAGPHIEGDCQIKYSVWYNLFLK